MLKLIIAIFALSALIFGFYLKPGKSLASDSGDGHAETKVESPEVRHLDQVESVKASMDENLNASLKSETTIDTVEKSQATTSVEGSSSVNLEEVLLQREISKAEIVAKYGNSEDGVLSEANFRRYAEERYLKRRDLNGDGKVDGYELRAIAQNGQSESPEGGEPSNRRER